MLFEKEAKLYSYEVRRESGESVAYVNYLGAPFIPNVAKSPEVMSRVIDVLIASPNVSRTVLVQQRNYNYDSQEVSMLSEIASLYNFLFKQEKVLSPERLEGNNRSVSQRNNFMSFFMQLLKRDPIAAYSHLKNTMIGETQAFGDSDIIYQHLLEKILNLLENTKLIQESVNLMDDYISGDRDIYNKIFIPDIIPNYAFARLVSGLPEDAKILSQYEIGKGLDKSTVTILKKPNELKYVYHIMPPEYFLNEDFQILLNLARNVLIEHQPKAEEFTDPERTRQVFFNVARDLLTELSVSKGIKASYQELNKLASILARHTIGFGLLEVLLQDTELQDIVLNAPVPKNPVLSVILSMMSALQIFF